MTGEMTMAMPMTYEIALAAAQDAGDRAMRKRGGKYWSRKDHEAACQAFERLRLLIRQENDEDGL
jgi:hypothetical protein